jgi:hypothetical protein
LPNDTASRLCDALRLSNHVALPLDVIVERHVSLVRLSHIVGRRCQDQVDAT